MDRILDRLWLGSLGDAVPYLRGDGTTQGTILYGMLSLNEAVPERAVPGFVHIHAPIPDEVCLPPDYWGGLVHALASLLSHQGHVLVHCRLGVSRAPALVAAYLSQIGSTEHPQGALLYVMRQRSCVRVHPETWRGVVEWWDQKG